MKTKIEPRKQIGRVAALLLFYVLVSTTTLAQPGELPGGRDALDMGFRFASAIVSDSKDMARAQQTLVYDYTTIGDYDQAFQRASQIQGWRRGIALARLAESLAQAGRIDKARRTLDLARQARRQAEGWYGPRIDSYVAEAYAAIGDIKTAGRMMADLAAADRQYQGRSVSMIAMVQARSGNYEEALQQLASLDDSKDIYDSWWQTRGYLSLLDLELLKENQRRDLLAKAAQATERIAGWKRIEALLSLADEYHSLGDDQAAGSFLDSAETLIESIPVTTPVKGHMTARLARALASSGSSERVRGLLARARDGLAQITAIERPELSAALSMAAHAAGDAELARKLMLDAISGAKALENARPRALAAVGICGAIGREGQGLDEATRASLTALFEELSDPW